MSLIALILAVCALFCSVYLYLELQKKLSSEDVVSKLSLASEELAKNYGRQFRNIETEWIDQYEKFKRLSGRMEKLKGLESSQNIQNEIPVPERTTTRNDLLRSIRRH